MIRRFIYDYIIQNKSITIIYMGYKQRMRKIKKEELRKNAKIIEQKKEEEKKLKEWILVDTNGIKSMSRVTF
jgi:hypothetical protein